MKVLMLTNIPSPYRVDFFNELSLLCHLTVTFEGRAATDRNKSWGAESDYNFNAHFLKGVRTRSDQFFCPEVIRFLREEYDQIVLCGYTSPTAMLAIEWLRLHRRKFWIEADGGFVEQVPFVKLQVKRHLISSANGWFSSGRCTDAYLEHYGAKRSGIRRYSFSSLRRQDIAERVLSYEEKLTLRHQMGLYGQRMILSVGKFAGGDGYRKGFDVLIKAAGMMRENCDIYIVGEKPTEDFTELADDLQLGNIHFIGYKGREELKQFYHAADVFCLPTREDIWGLVINEAMSAGLPIVTTDRCVAGIELVKDGACGYILPAGDEEALAKQLDQMLQCGDILLKQMGEKSLQRIQHFTVEQMAKEHMKAFEQCEWQCRQMQ